MGTRRAPPGPRGRSLPAGKVLRSATPRRLCSAFQRRRGPGSVLPSAAGTPQLAAGDAEVWPAGAGRFREGGRPVPGRGGIPSSCPESSRGAAGGAPALGYRQHLSGDPSRSALPRPDPRALREGRAERSALLRRLHFSGRWPLGREG